MKRVFAWLETKLSRSESRARAATTGDDGTASPGTVTLDVKLPKEIHNLVNDESIPTVDPLAADADTSPGFNPYDTARLHKK